MAKNKRITQQSGTVEFGSGGDGEDLTEMTATIAFAAFIEQEKYREPGVMTERFVVGMVPEDLDLEKSKTGAFWEFWPVSFTRDSLFAQLAKIIVELVEAEGDEIPGLTWNPKGGNDGDGALVVEDLPTLPARLAGYTFKFEKQEMRAGRFVSKERWTPTEYVGKADTVPEIKGLPKTIDADTYDLYIDTVEELGNAQVATEEKPTKRKPTRKKATKKAAKATKGEDADEEEHEDTEEEVNGGDLYNILTRKDQAKYRSMVEQKPQGFVVKKLQKEHEFTDSEAQAIYNHVQSELAEA